MAYMETTATVMVASLTIKLSYVYNLSFCLLCVQSASICLSVFLPLMCTIFLSASSGCDFLAVTFEVGAVFWLLSL